MKALGLVLVVVGVLALGYQGFSWTRKDTVVDAGPIAITRDKTEGVSIPPVAGAILIVAGVALLATSLPSIALRQRTGRAGGRR